MKFFTGLILGVILLPLIALAVIWLGDAPVAASAPPLPLERRLASLALRERISREAPKTSPISPTEPNLLAGAKTYRENCAVCHGTFDGPETAIAKGMFPPPPKLLHGKGVSDDPVGETYWKASNGIRLTGMPAFKGSLTDEQIWQVSQLLANSDKLPPSVHDLLNQAVPAQ